MMAMSNMDSSAAGLPSGYYQQPQVGMYQQPMMNSAPYYYPQGGVAAQYPQQQVPAQPLNAQQLITDPQQQQLESNNTQTPP